MVGKRRSSKPTRMVIIICFPDLAHPQNQLIKTQTRGALVALTTARLMQKLCRSNPNEPKDFSKNSVIIFLSIEDSGMEFKHTTRTQYGCRVHQIIQIMQ